MALFVSFDEDPVLSSLEDNPLITNCRFIGLTGTGAEFNFEKDSADIVERRAGKLLEAIHHQHQGNSNRVLSTRKLYAAETLQVLKECGWKSVSSTVTRVG